MLHHRLKNNPSGFTLVESMIALGIIGVILMAVMIYISQSNDQNLYTEAVNNRMSIAQSLSRTISNFDDIVASAKASPANSALRVCLGIAKGTCSATDAKKPVSFELYGYKGTVRVAGTDAAPVAYSRIGVPNCGAVPGSKLCPFWHARAYFSASCPNGAASCDQASTVMVRFNLTPIEAKFMNKTIPGQSLSASHKVFRTALKTPQACGDGSEQVGLSPDGLVQCRCRPGFVQIGKTPEGQPVCKNQKDAICDKGEILKGWNADSSPYCVKVEAKCGWQDFETDGAKCKNSGWMEQIDLGICRPNKKKEKDKSSSRAIKCERNKGWCCHYEEVK